MRANKYIFITILTLIICSVLSHIMAFFVNIGVSVMIGTVTGLLGFVGLSCMACYWSRTITSLNIMAERIKKSKPGPIKVKTTSVLSPLLDAINKFSSESVDRADELEKQTTEFNLELQLLQKQKQNTEAIIYSIKDSVVVIDAFDRVIMANAAAGDLFGFAFKDGDRSPVDELIRHEEFVKLLLHSRRSKLRHVKHELNIDRDEGMSTFDCIISCVKDDNDLISGVVAILHDITKEKEISQMKNDFVSHVSHELKTPLASINAYAEMLVDGEASDQKTINEFCSIIQSQAQRLNRLIEEILNISRIESGLIKVDKQPVSVTILMQDAAKMIESYAGEKSITINIPAPIIYDQVNADKDMISQVIINLLSNAVKYTPENGTVSVHSEVNEADEVVRVTVSDTGIGIPPEDVEHVFDKFFRVEANKKYAKGTGLGLNLVKQIVEKVHGGKVFVTSQIDKGSTFGFELPLFAKQPAEVR